MRIVRTSSELRTALKAERVAGRSIGFVPTMGALHDGHLSLVRLARAKNDTVVLSIFVNPLQFGPSEDLGRYPRPEETDLARADSEGVDIAFLPTVQDMYPEGRVTSGRVTSIRVAGVTEVLEGAHRPGHFDGVATVVAKLFNLVDPDVAFFGQKDAQQVAVIRRMVADLDFDLEIVVGETIREADGLAMSSRNAYLSHEDRGRALSLSRALAVGSRSIRAGESPQGAEQTMLNILKEADVTEVDYAAAVDPDTFGPPGDGDVLLAIAAWVGPTRLIDNEIVKASRRGTA